MQRPDYDYLFKSAIFGADYYHHHHTMFNKLGATDMDFIVKTVNVNDKIVKLQVFDTDNSKIFSRSLSEHVPGYIRGLHIAVILYDMADPDLDMVKSYIEQMRRYMRTMPVIAIVGVQSKYQVHNDDHIKLYANESKCLWQNGLDIHSDVAVEELLAKVCAAQMEQLKILSTPQAKPEPAPVLAPAPHNSCSVL